MRRGAPPGGRHKALALEDPADGACRRPGLLGLVLLEPGGQLPRSPGRMLAAQLHQSVGYLGRCLSRAVIRGSGSVFQALGSLAPLPLSPLVPGLPADSVPLAQLCHCVQTPLEICNKSGTAHMGFLAPRHSGIPLRYPNTPSRNYYPMCPSDLLPMSPVCPRSIPPSWPPPCPNP